MDSKRLALAFTVVALLITGCTKEKVSQDKSVRNGEARSVFVRNDSGIPMRFNVEINGLSYETIDLDDGRTIIYYEPLPVGMARDQVERYKIDGKLTDNLGRSMKGNDIEFSLDMAKSGVYPYLPSGWQNSSLYPSYNFTEPLGEWLESINAEARMIEDFKIIRVVASPIEKTENEGGEPGTSLNADKPRE